jgi:hypothetical protein
MEHLVTWSRDGKNEELTAAQLKLRSLKRLPSDSVSTLCRTLL